MLHAIFYRPNECNLKIVHLFVVSCKSNVQMLWSSLLFEFMKEGKANTFLPTQKPQKCKSKKTWLYSDALFRKDKKNNFMFTCYCFPWRWLPFLQHIFWGYYLFNRMHKSVTHCHTAENSTYIFWWGLNKTKSIKPVEFLQREVNPFYQNYWFCTNK